ncbi:MAG: hypothetical protein LBJ16_00805 [Holosporaceae bacterium]|nr:hypothetical protein [Holosporaceae bacterium]
MKVEWNDFDYNGYNEEELQKLSDERSIPYILRESYSFGKIIREYGFYPSLLPLTIYHLHGAGRVFSNHPYQHELDSKAYCMFVNNSADVQTYSDAGMDCEVMFHPFVYYRRSRKIEKSQNAKGTIIFPSHMTPDVDDLSDVSEYIEQIKNLPDIYKPLSVCMCWVDITQGKHKVWMENGFPVYTVGNAYHEEFVERFYDLIRHFKFMTSNSIGSQTYYAVEMGIPFFLFGSGPQYFNKTDPNFPKGKMDIHKHENYKKIHNLFTELTTEINPRQKQAVLEGLGVHDGISRLKMMRILYMGFFKGKKVTFSLLKVTIYLLKNLFCHGKNRKKRRRFGFFSGMY